MARGNNREIIILKSTESGHSYASNKNKNNTKERLEIKKFDPILRKHVVYKEKK